jgi:putative nucleotidyltransferase with HDIG domain
MWVANSALSAFLDSLAAFMLKRIAVTELCLGMHIHELCGSWMEHPFWKTSFLLNSPKDLRRIGDCGILEVWIDTSKGHDLLSGQTVEEVEEQTAAILLEAQLPPALPVTQGLADLPASAVEVPISLEQEVAQAIKLCRQSKSAVVSMFQQVRLGQAIDTGQVGELVEAISDSLLRHPIALISLARLKRSDEYTYMHSVAVCALMIALARRLDLPQEQVEEAGMAGLLHDVGKMMVSDIILNKPGKLTDAEFTTMRGHPQAGGAVLLASRNVAPRVLDVCLHHHEKIDGSGYPHALSGEQISLFARMGAVCDVYDAVTSERSYKHGWDPADAVHRMAGWKGHFDKQVFQAFVQTVGIYPTGSLVRLQSERLGVVIEQAAHSLLTPKVKVFYSVTSNTPIAHEVLDLATLLGSERIVCRESARAWGFRNLEQLWSGLPARPGSYFD